MASWTGVRSHYESAGESEENLIKDFPQDMKMMRSISALCASTHDSSAGLGFFGVDESRSLECFSLLNIVF